MLMNTVSLLPISPFFFTDPPTTEIYTLSLHDALPICAQLNTRRKAVLETAKDAGLFTGARGEPSRSEEHTSELQSRQYLVCRLLLEKKKTPTMVLNTATIRLQKSTSTTTRHIPAATPR